MRFLASKIDLQFSATKLHLAGQIFVSFEVGIPTFHRFKSGVPLRPPLGGWHNRMGFIPNYLSKIPKVLSFGEGWSLVLLGRSCCQSWGSGAPSSRSSPAPPCWCGLKLVQVFAGQWDGRRSSCSAHQVRLLGGN